MASPRQNRFQSFSPLRNSTHSLRRLRTAFSPTRSTRSISPSSSTDTTSPLTYRTASPDSHRSFGTNRSTSTSRSIRQLLMVRRKPSIIEIEMEEERHLFSAELEMLEPRPALGGHVEMGIFQVLDGRC